MYIPMTRRRELPARWPSRTGSSAQNGIQVLSGLDYSDQVITTWTKELYEGAPVQLAEGSGTDAETSLDGGESAGAGESPEAGNGEAPMTDAPGEPAADAAAGEAEAPEPAAEETSAEETSANAQ